MLFYLSDMVMFHRKLAKSLTTRRVASIPPGRPGASCPRLWGMIFHGENDDKHSLWIQVPSYDSDIVPYIVFNNSYI